MDATPLTLPVIDGMTVKVLDDSPDWYRVQTWFPNNYGASIIRNYISYGHENELFEIAVLNADGSLDYTTTVTSDVIGNLTVDGVHSILFQIAELEYSTTLYPTRKT